MLSCFLHKIDTVQVLSRKSCPTVKIDSTNIFPRAGRCRATGNLMAKGKILKKKDFRLNLCGNRHGAEMSKLP